METKQCPKCGHANQPNAHACQRCGIIFAKYNPAPAAPSGPRKCHEVDYTILGDDMQMVEIELDPGETVIAEAGAMNYMDRGISFEAKMGDGSEANEGMLGKLLGAGKRVLTGESIFMTHFTNTGSGKKTVAFAAPYPGKIIPIDMAKMRGLRHESRYRVYETPGSRILWRRGIYSPKTQWRRHGLHPGRWHNCEKRVAQ